MNPFTILAGVLFFLPLAGPIIVEPIIAIRDLWTAKEMFALMAILVIATQHHKRSYIASQNPKNPFLVALLIFLPISAYSAPPILLIYGHENLGGIWIFRAMGWCFVYYLLYQAIRLNSPTRERHKRIIALAIGWSAILSAGYAYLQALGLDQWQTVRGYDEIGHTAVAHITAMIGNPTYLAVFLVICLPFLALFFRWYWTIFVAGAVLICKSDIGLIGLFLVSVLLVCLRARSTIWFKAVLWVAAGAGLIFGFFWSEVKPYVAQRANGRLAVWEQVIEDWQSPCIKIPVTSGMTDSQKAEIEKLNKRTYTLTGRGLGSFPFIFSPKYSTPFESAHNEYLETLYSIGLIGLGFLIFSLGFVFYYSFHGARADPFCMALYVSFFFICFSAAGLPIWHIEPLRFYSASIFSLLSCWILRRER